MPTFRQLFEFDDEGGGHGGGGGGWHSARRERGMYHILASHVDATEKPHPEADHIMRRMSSDSWGGMPIEPGAHTRSIQHSLENNPGFEFSTPNRNVIH